MVILACNMLSYTYPITPFFTSTTKTPYNLSHKTSVLKKYRIFASLKFSLNGEQEEEERERFKWVEIGLDLTEAQKHSISLLPPKMSKRCKALMEQLICFDPQKTNLSRLLVSWVKIMKPIRADWLSVLKQMSKLEHPLLFEVTEFALLEESFEANVRDYTKIIDGYGKQNRLLDAETALQAMKKRGFTVDQITLTVLVQMYSKAGNLNQAEETFEEIKLLGLPLDKRSYGSMIMAYIRAGMVDRGESLLGEMEAQDLCAGSEVYKALLRAYSSIGDTNGAQRVFDAIQFAGIAPDARLCALLMNAYAVAGQSDGARIVFENMRKAGLEPSDKCMAVMLSAYEKENKLNAALDLLMDLERDGIMVCQEASEVLARWFRRLGVVDEVELVLRDYATKDIKHKTRAF